jgi:ribosomal protein L20
MCTGTVVAAEESSKYNPYSIQQQLSLLWARKRQITELWILRLSATMNVRNAGLCGLTVEARAV